MAHHNDGRNSNGETRSKRGSVRNDRRLAAIAQRRKGVAADWLGCDSESIQAIVHQITQLGGAVIFGTSRDGGAYSVTLLLEGEKEILWINGDSDLDKELSAVVDVLHAMQE